MALVLCPTTTLPEYYYSATLLLYYSATLLLLTGQVSGPVGDVKVKPAIAPTEERMPWD